MPANIPEHASRIGMDTAGCQGRLHLNLNKSTAQAMPRAAGQTKPINRRPQRKIGAFPISKQPDSCLYLLGRQVQLIHHRSCRTNLVFRYPAVGFGNVAHYRKSGRKENILNLPCIEPGAAAHALFQSAIKLVSDNEPSNKTDRAETKRAQQHPSEDAASDLPPPVHQPGLRHLQQECCGILREIDPSV